MCGLRVESCLLHTTHPLSQKKEEEKEKEGLFHHGWLYWRHRMIDPVSGGFGRGGSIFQDSGE